MTLAGKRLSSRLEQRKVERFFDECVDAVANKSIEMLRAEVKDIPDNEVAAAVAAVGDTLKEADLTSQALFSSNLDARVFEARLRPVAAEVMRRSYLSSEAEQLYHIVLTEACTYAVELATNLPRYEASAFREILTRQSALIDSVNAVLERLPERDATDAFSTYYRRLIVKKFDRMQLFGITTSRQGSRNYPLTVAFLALTALRRHETRDRITAGSERVPQVLAEAPRLLVTGEAGSGKTTLLRWIAVQSARRSFADPLSSWNNTIPFFIPLREFADRELPVLHDFPTAGLKHLFAPLPPSTWVHDLMSAGRAVILVDGVDELPAGRTRENVRDWLQGLVSAYPNARYIVTSRPGAVTQRWLFEEGFSSTELQSLSPSDVRAFVSQWHTAVAAESDDGGTSLASEVVATLITSIENDRRLRELCSNPLLCALVCALNRDRSSQLPRSLRDIYKAALEMLLERRDRERFVSNPSALAAEDRMYVLQNLAAYLVRNAWSSTTTARTLSQLQRTKQYLSNPTIDSTELLRDLVERSGILREAAVGQIDFIHRSFQEYLAGKHFVESDDIGLLLSHAHDDQWRDVIIFAAGQGREKEANELVKGLLDIASSADADTRSRLLPIACLQSARVLDPGLRQATERLAASLVPPNTMETARVLGGMGEWVLDLLRTSNPQTSQQAEATIRAATLVGGVDAIHVIATIAIGQWSEGVAEEVIRAWKAFDVEDYASRVIGSLPLRQLTVTDPDLVPLIVHARNLEDLELTGRAPEGLRDVSVEVVGVKRLVVGGDGLDDLTGVGRFVSATHLYLVLRPHNPDLSAIADLLGLEYLALTSSSTAMIGFKGWAELPRLARLKELQISQPDNSLVNVVALRGRPDLVVRVRPAMTVIGGSEVRVIVAEDSGPSGQPEAEC